MYLIILSLYRTLAIQRYNRSLAVNSMIGYLMGIGDRHMNNILIDTNTGLSNRSVLLLKVVPKQSYGRYLLGEFIHIDFGVVFEKGKYLAIPEVVPFRLTRDVVAGLGPLGFEGAFRMNCEVTLEVHEL